MNSNVTGIGRRTSATVALVAASGDAALNRGSDCNDWRYFSLLMAWNVYDRELPISRMLYLYITNYIFTCNGRLQRTEMQLTRASGLVTMSALVKRPDDLSAALNRPNETVTTFFHPNIYYSASNITQKSCKKTKKVTPLKESYQLQGITVLSIVYIRKHHERHFAQVIHLSARHHNCSHSVCTPVTAKKIKAHVFKK